MTRIISKPMGKDLLLYDSQKDAVHVLNPAARLIYRLKQEGKDTGAIVQALKEGFAVDGDIDIENDIQTALVGMKDKGLL